MSHLNSRSTILALAQALLLCACGSTAEAPKQDAVRLQEENALAQNAAPASMAASAPVAAASPAAVPSGAAVRVFIDPVTGQRREPTAAELKALAAARPANEAITSKPKEKKEIVLQNGAIALEEDTLSEMKGCVQKNGSVVVDHDCKSSAPASAKKP